MKIVQKRNKGTSIACATSILATFLMVFYTNICLADPTPADQLKALQDDLAKTKKELIDLRDSYIKYADSTGKNLIKYQDSVSQKLAKAAEPKERDLSPYETLLWLSPIILFLIFLLYLARKIDLKNAIKDAISDKDAPRKVTTETKMATPSTLREMNGVQTIVEGEPAKTTTNNEDFPKSASRMTMFFSSLLSIILALSFTTTFLYGYLKGMHTPDYSALVDVLLSLGIGVIPYTINQFTKKGTS